MSTNLRKTCLKLLKFGYRQPWPCCSIVHGHLDFVPQPHYL
ncbi:unnamed protein product [Spodoptera exigua]|nr:unnamed protein product [Spodoptera exigua]